MTRHRIHRATAEAAELRRQRKPDEPELRHRLPRVATVALGRGDDLPARVEIVVALDEAGDRGGELPPFFGAVEIHDGRPSTCFAMMLRWISFEPA